MPKFRNSPRKALCAPLITAFAALSFLAGTASAEISLVFGTYAAEKPTATVQKFKPFLTYLADSMSEAMGEQVTISMQISQNYEDSIAALVKGKVDFVRFGPASYIKAKAREKDIDIIVMESKNGPKTFKGVIAVHQNSKITSLADLSGKSFAFGSELSTIGRFLAQEELLNAGIDAQSLKRYAYLGRHDRVGTAVGKGDFDAGALKSSTFEKLQSKNVPIRALVKFSNVTKPWLARAGLDQTIIATLRQIMLATTDKDVLKTISKSGFLAGTDSDYMPTRNAMQRSLAFGG